MKIINLLPGIKQDDYISRQIVMNKSGFDRRKMKRMNIHVAAASGKMRRVRRLLKGGLLGRPKASTNVNEKRDGLTPLHTAARYGRREIAKLLLKYGADVNVNSDYGISLAGRTPLHEAVEHGEKEICALLLEHDAEVNASDPKNETPLHVAAKEGYTEICGLLISNGADINARAKDGQTPLFYATCLGRTETCRFLLQSGADLNSVSLHSLAWTATGEMCELLLEHGADVNARDEEDRTPLHKASEILPGRIKILCGTTAEKHIKVTAEMIKQTAEVLLHDGADINAKDTYGRTPLHTVKNADIAEYLLAQSADINAKDRDHRTPLHHAANDGRTEIVTVLLEHGADVNIKDKLNRTPLEEISEMIDAELAYDQDSVFGMRNWMEIRRLLRN